MWPWILLALAAVVAVAGVWHCKRYGCADKSEWGER